jgi:exopolysaccharide production protein ExoQ
MIQFVGTVAVVIGIVGLFRFARDGSRTSKALWIPVIWLFLAGSRPVSLWFHIQQIGTSADAQLEGSPIDRNILTALIVSALIVLIGRGQKVGALLRANGPILLFLFYCGASIVWSDFPDVAFKRWIRAVGDIVMVLVVLTDANPSAAVNRFLARAGFVIVPLSILLDLGRGYEGSAGKYYIGVTTGKNMLGMICMVVGLAAVWRFISLTKRGELRGRTRRLIAHGTIAAGAFFLVRMADSATSTACFVLGGCLIFATNRWAFARRPAVVHFVVASMLFMALYSSILNPDAGVISTMGRNPTLTGRTDVWKSVLDMAPDPLLGAGFESFWLGPRLKKLWSIYVWQPNEAHNGYIEVYLNLGWAGVFLLALVILTAYRKVVRGLRLDMETGNLRLAYFVVALIYSLTEAGFRIFSSVWIVFLLSIVAGATLQRVKSSSAPTAPKVSWDYSKACA